MKNTVTSTTSYSHPFMCACGELYSSIRAASCCRKCRNYTWQGYCTHVIDVRTGDVVHGREPTPAENRAAEVAYKARQAEEMAWFKEAEARREAEALEEARLAEEAAVDEWFERMWAIQDRLMAS